MMQVQCTVCGRYKHHLLPCTSGRVQHGTHPAGWLVEHMTPRDDTPAPEPAWLLRWRIWCRIGHRLGYPAPREIALQRAELVAGGER